MDQKSLLRLVGKSHSIDIIVDSVQVKILVMRKTGILERTKQMLTSIFEDRGSSEIELVLIFEHEISLEDLDLLEVGSILEAIEEKGADEDTLEMIAEDLSKIADL